MRQQTELFENLPPPLASVVRKHFTSERPRTGRPDDLANDIECDRSSVFNLAKTTDMVARKIRRMIGAYARDHFDLARDVFDALGFRDAGYSIVRTADPARMRQATSEAEAALRRVPALDVEDVA